VNLGYDDAADMHVLRAIVLRGRIPRQQLPLPPVGSVPEPMPVSPAGQAAAQLAGTRRRPVPGRDRGGPGRVVRAGGRKRVTVAVLIAIPLLAIGIACHVLAVLACNRDKRDKDQETGS